jgi:hypothetical protein
MTMSIDGISRPDPAERPDRPVRARGSRMAGRLSPTLAEQLILSALRNAPLRGQPDETVRAYTQFVLLRELVSDLDDEQLGMLLAQARDGAERVSRPAPPYGPE